MSIHSAVCIEVFLGPEMHPLLIEQWQIELVNKYVLLVF